MKRRSMRHSSMSRQSSHCGNASLRLIRKIRGVIGAAAAFVSRDFGIGAERAGANFLAVFNARSGEVGRGLLLLDPRFECGEHLEMIGPLAAAAMSHGGDHV